MDGLTNITENPPSDDQQMVIINRPLYKRPWFIVVITLLCLVLAVFFWLSYVGFQTYSQLKDVQLHASNVSAAFSARNLSQANDELSATKTSLGQAYAKYRLAYPLRFLWPLGNYLKDGERLFNAGNNIKVTEIDNRDRLNMFDLFEIKNPNIYWDKNAKILYIQSEEKFYKAIDLLP